jgi:tetratricopeptide (TPR) repeat protein
MDMQNSGMNKLIELQNLCNSGAEPAVLLEQYLKLRHHEQFYSIPSSTRTQIAGLIATKLPDISLVDDFDQTQAIGNVYLDARLFSKSEEWFARGISIKSDNSWSYFHLAESQKEQSKFHSAAINFEKADTIGINFSFSNFYAAQCWDLYGDFVNSERCFRSALRVDSSDEWILLEFSKFLARRGRYQEALEYTNKIVLDKCDSYIQERSREMIESLLETLKSPEVVKIGEYINSIIDAAEYEGTELTHYTSISTAYRLIFDNSPFRISEASYLNDPLEGRVLDNHLREKLDECQITKFICCEEQEISSYYVPKPYVFSFVNPDKSNNLTLWRMYGKEGDREAAGCSITFDKKELIDCIIQSLIDAYQLLNKSNERRSQVSDSLSKDDCRIFHVIYFKKNGEIIFNGRQEKGFQINHSLGQLIEVLSTSSCEPAYISHQLGRICYLFKDAEYKDEDELRFIIPGTNVASEIDSTPTLPRVYLPIKNIFSAMQRITVGPKAINPNEVQAALFHSLKKNNNSIRINRSQLPFR